MILEFEGIYKDAAVYVNDRKAAFHGYGYTGFYVDITEYLQPGQNQLRVEVRNSDQPNSRWYTGTGIYRPVCEVRASIPEAELWSPSAPRLYVCRASYGEDSQEIPFGIRTFQRVRLSAVLPKKDMEGKKEFLDAFEQLLKKDAKNEEWKKKLISEIREIACD